MNKILLYFHWVSEDSHEPVTGVQKNQEQIRSTIFTLRVVHTCCPEYPRLNIHDLVLSCGFVHSFLQSHLITTELSFQD